MLLMRWHVLLVVVFLYSILRLTNADLTERISKAANYQNTIWPTEARRMTNAY